MKYRNWLLTVSELMQYTRQRGQLGWCDAAAQNPLGGAGFAQAARQGAAQLRNIVRLTVCQWMRHGMPWRFDRVQLRRVRGQLLQVQTRVVVAERLQPLGVVDRRTGPDDDDVAAKMFKQVAEKVLNLIAREVLFVKPEVESEPLAFWTDRQATDDRDPGVVVAIADDGGLTHPRPGTPNGGNQHEARFVGKDDVRTQPRGVFFTRGQSLRFHGSIRTSSRSSARLSGFWQLKPKSCSRRAA